MEGKGTEKILFHLLGKNVDCRAPADNAAWLRLPGKAFAVAGVYGVNEAALAVGEMSLFGRQLKKRAAFSGLRRWERQTGILPKEKLIIETKNEVTVELKLHNRPGAASLKAAAAKGWYGIRLLPGNPAVVKVINNAWLCVGMDDGTILAMDAAGGVTRQGRVDGRPVDVEVLASPKGAVAIVTTITGNISGFTIPAL